MAATVPVAPVKTLCVALPLTFTLPVNVSVVIRDPVSSATRRSVPSTRSLAVAKAAINTRAHHEFLCAIRAFCGLHVKKSTPRRT